MIVVEVIAEPRRRDYLRCEGDVGADIVVRVRRGKAQPVREAVDRRTQNRRVDKITRLGRHRVLPGQICSGFAPVSIKPRTEEADLRRQREIKPRGSVVLLAVLSEQLVPEAIKRTNICWRRPELFRIVGTNGGTEIHSPASALVQRSKAKEKPQTVFDDWTAHGKAGLNVTEVILLVLIDLRVVVETFSAKAEGVIAQPRCGRTVHCVRLIRGEE